MTNNTVYDHIADHIAEHGYCIIDDFLDNALLEKLQQRIQSLTEHQLHAAGIGRGKYFQLADTIRSDKTLWLEDSDPIDSEFLQQMDSFRLAINQRIFLGLFDYECHYAIYPKGAFYKKHLDAFKGKSNRVLSTVFYLNKDWQADNGGELLIYKPESNDVLETVQPNLGRLVIFLSEQFPHEVLPAKQQRYSIAGWFRLNP
jgi:SM-20-related protein